MGGLARFSKKARARVIIPTLPIYISAMSSESDMADKSEVMPTLNPQVAIAETVSTKTSARGNGPGSMAQIITVDAITAII